MTLRLADSFVDGSAFINLVRLYEAAEGKKQRVTGGSGDLTESRHGCFRGLVGAQPNLGINFNSYHSS